MAETRLREMVDAHFDFLWRLVRRLGVREGDVEDAVQQTFVVAARKVESILPGRDRAFLAATALRVAADARRARARRPEDATENVGEAIDFGPGPEELADRIRARAVLDGILDEMPYELRTVFVLYELEEITTPEIAALVGVPLGTAASRLRRAREVFSAAVVKWRGAGVRRTSDG